MLGSGFKLSSFLPLLSSEQPSSEGLAQACLVFINLFFPFFVLFFYFDTLRLGIWYDLQ